MNIKSIMQQLIDDELQYIIENCDGFGVPEAEALTSSELDELKDIILNLAYRDIDDLIVRKLKTYIDNKEN